MKEITQLDLAKMKPIVVALALIAVSGFVSAKPVFMHEDNLLNVLLQQEEEEGGGGGGRRVNKQDGDDGVMLQEDDDDDNNDGRVSEQDEGDDGIMLQEDDDDDNNDGRVSEQDEGDEGNIIGMMQGGGEEREDTDPAVAKLKTDLKAALLQEDDNDGDGELAKIEEIISKALMAQEGGGNKKAKEQWFHFILHHLFRHAVKHLVKHAIRHIGRRLFHHHHHHHHHRHHHFWKNKQN